MEEQNLVLGNFTIQASAPNGKSFTVSGYIYSTQGEDEINSQIDKLHRVIDRQRTIAEIPELEARLEQRTQALADIKEHFASLEDKKNRKQKLNNSETTNYENAKVTLRKLNEEIEKGKIAISEAKGKAGCL